MPSTLKSTPLTPPRRADPRQSIKSLWQCVFLIKRNLRDEALCRTCKWLRCIVDSISSSRDTGDEVIVQGNTYIASVMGITINGATPIFVEPDEYFNIDVSKIIEEINR